MHDAKESGKNAIRFFSDELANAARERMDIDFRLRKALALAEFRLQFQPQFSVDTLRPKHFEALIRWCPQGEPSIPPGKFIPLAEKNGLIVPIGTWVLNEACASCAAWQAGNLQGAGVAVNVSALQFAVPDFVETVARALAATGLAPELLELELTESVFVRDAIASAHTLTRLRSLGITISLDDFGTGYSSMSYLQKLPIDALKIDRSFVLEAEASARGAAILRCVMDLAHTLGLRVIGEGAETVAQMELLCRLACDEVQGFLLARPAFDVASVAEPAGWKHCL